MILFLRLEPKPKNPKPGEMVKGRGWADQEGSFSNFCVTSLGDGVTFSSFDKQDNDFS